MLCAIARGLFSLAQTFTLAGRTYFVIAHRLCTIRNADEVLMLDGGQIIEPGTHTGLSVAKGFYFDLHMSQFKWEVDVVEAGSPEEAAPDVFFGPGY